MLRYPASDCGGDLFTTHSEQQDRVVLSAGVDVRELRYFSVLCEELHFGRAAARLHISQPPLSQAIAQLESKLGLRLLDRTTRQVAVTPAGKVLTAHAVRLLSELDDAIGATRRAALAERGTLRVAAGVVARETVLPALSYVVSQRFPHLSLDATHEVGDEVLRSVVSGGADLGLVVSPAETDGLVSRIVRRERPVAIVHATSALGNAASATVAELAKHDLLIWPRRHSAGSHDLVLELFGRTRPASIVASEFLSGGWWSELRRGAFAVLPEGAAVSPEYARVAIADARVEFATHAVWSVEAAPAYLPDLLDAFDVFAEEEGWLAPPRAAATSPGGGDVRVLRRR